MRTHQVVLAWVEAEISAKRLALGERLPAERAIAEQLGVSRTSVREAIRVLEAMGVVRSGVGSGPDAGTVLIADPSAAFTAALRLHFATSHLPVNDLVQTRVLLESWAATRAEPGAPALTTAKELLTAMEAPEVDAQQFHRLDAEFHVALSQAAGNVLISTMMGSLRGAIEQYTLDLIVHLPDWSATAARLRAEHRAILAAITAGRGDEASALIVEHIEGYYREAGIAGD